MKKRKYHLDVCTPPPEYDFLFSFETDSFSVLYDFYFGYLDSCVKCFLFVDGVCVRVDDYIKECDF